VSVFLWLLALGLATAVPIVLVGTLVRLVLQGRELRDLRERVAALEAASRHPAADPEPPPQPAPPDAAAPARAVAPPEPRAPLVDEPLRAVSPATIAPMPPAAPRPEVAASAPERPAFAWESLLGVRAAAWAGGVALVFAGILFAKFAIDRDLITPVLRVAILTLSGAGALAGAELFLRRGYAATANAVSGAGIAVLYAAFYAGHALYGLFGLGTAFTLMALVTVAACLLAVRYDAFFTALLGLLGGFATPLALASDVDRPASLFAYLLLLDAGLLGLALRRRWHALVPLSLIATFLVELIWYSSRMAPHKSATALTGFLLLGLLYLLLPLVSGSGGEARTIGRASALGGLVPFVFVLLMAGDAPFAGRWPLLFGFTALLDAALAFVAIRRMRPALLLGGSLATALMLVVWASAHLTRPDAWGASLGAIALAALLNLPGRVAPRVGAAAQRLGDGFTDAGIFAGVGLYFFALALVTRGLGEPPWTFAALLLALVLLLLERRVAGAPAGLMPGAAFALAFLAQSWFFAATNGATFARNLALPVLLAIALSLVSGRLARGAERPSVADEAAALIAALLAVLGLFACLVRPSLSAPQPLFAATAALVGVLLLSALRRDWTPVPAAAGAAAALLATLFQETRFVAADLGVVLPIYLGFVGAFTAFPFLVPASAGPAWRRSTAPWALSALSGLLFLPASRAAVQDGWGRAYLGLLPLLFAGVTLAGLRGAASVFPASAEAEAARLRLRTLALYAGSALALVALAFPMQLDRQWVVVAWAVQGAGMLWLFGKLPHVGLRRLGLLLLALSGARLLLAPSVATWAERGLPIVNWLLYTYGVPAAACLVGGRLLARAERGERAAAAGVRPTRFPDAAGLLGLLLLFALLNLEIAGFFSTGSRIELGGRRGYARDLTTSLAWGVYAVALLAVGMWRRHAGLRRVALGFLLLAVGKVFLYDLSALGGLHRVVSFLGLGLALLGVSLAYQRFVVGPVRGEAVPRLAEGSDAATAAPLEGA
jgi:uncharacterized membrane protein